MKTRPERHTGTRSGEETDTEAEGTDTVLTLGGEYRRESWTKEGLEGGRRPDPRRWG